MQNKDITLNDLKELENEIQNNYSGLIESDKRILEYYLKSAIKLFDKI